MPRFLCVGTATLDIINHVARYPAENSEVRATAQHVRRGGNAANTAVVLAQLGNETAWAGNLGDRPEAALVREDMVRHGVDIGGALTIPGARPPTSCILVSEAGGSRSIVHYRDMPEYSAEAFGRLDLVRYDWIHFEGRAVEQLQRMLTRAKQMGLRISLEVEKPRPGIELLFGKPGLLMFSGDYLAARGEQDPERFLASLPAGSIATCTRGEAGAWARDAEGEVVHVEAFRPERVIDTVGAGDVFNAGLLDALGRGAPLREALRAAVRLAGIQCGREGLEL